jgi:hypothetical protein
VGGYPYRTRAHDRGHVGRVEAGHDLQQDYLGLVFRQGRD